MKAYIGIKYYQDYRNKLIIEGISSALESKGFETICLAREIDTKDQIISSPQILMKLTFEKIEDCDLVVIDLSEISETLEGISEEIIFYDSIGDLENIDFLEVQSGRL